MRRIGEEKEKEKKMVWVRLENRKTKMGGARKKEKPAG